MGISQLLGARARASPQSLRLCNEAFNHCVVCARCL